MTEESPEMTTAGLNSHTQTLAAQSNPNQDTCYSDSNPFETREGSPRNKSTVGNGLKISMDEIGSTGNMMGETNRSRQSLDSTNSMKMDELLYQDADRQSIFKFGSGSSSLSGFGSPTSSVDADTARNVIASGELGERSGIGSRSRFAHEPTYNTSPSSSASFSSSWHNQPQRTNSTGTASETMSSYPQTRSNTVLTSTSSSSDSLPTRSNSPALSSSVGGDRPPTPPVGEVVRPRGDPFDMMTSSFGQPGEGGPATQASRSSTTTATHPYSEPQSELQDRDPQAPLTGERDMYHYDDDEGDDLAEAGTGNEFIQAPIFTRSISSPLPARIKHLKHPLMNQRLSHRGSDASAPTGSSIGGTSASSSLQQSQTRTNDLPSPSGRPALSTSNSGSTDDPIEAIVTPSALQTLSLELADSLQSAIQTLLHLSPPHLLDSAKEQYSGCTVQLPTTSISALLTAMKGLNYLSANVQELCMDPMALEPVISSTSSSRVSFSSQASSGIRGTLSNSVSRKGSLITLPDSALSPNSDSQNLQHRHRSATMPNPSHDIFDSSQNHDTVQEDFDIGELLQSTADLLGGLAAQAGVDIVLFHGDVGIKHVSVRGDGEGISYALSHVSYILRCTGKAPDLDWLT